jgi:hypothetical protein
MGPLGQIYEYLLLLQNVFEVDHPIGILTTMEEFRICWLPDHVAGLPDMSPLGERPFMAIPVPPEREKDESKENDDTKIQMLVSPVVSMDDNILNNVVATALFGMSLCKSNPDQNPFDRKKVFVNVTSEVDLKMLSFAMIFKKPEGFELPRMPMDDCRSLYLLKSLGVGAHGYTWLAGSESGALCVLKFEHPKQKKDKPENEPENEPEPPKSTIDVEFKVWNAVHSELEVKIQVWRAQNALVMPYFAQASIVSSASIRDTVPENDPRTVDAVRKELENFADKGIEHQDVKWANIGFYTTKDGELKAVLIDHGHFAERENWERQDKSAWVAMMMAKLEGEARLHQDSKEIN